MRFDRPLDEILRSRSFVRVLRALHVLPDGMAVSARDIARRAQISHPTSSSVLRVLVAQGLVIAQRSPGGDGFTTNKDHVLAPALSLLFEREQGLEEDLEEFLREHIHGRSIQVSGAFLFGSAASGSADEASDIDLAILCRPEDQDAVAEAFEDVADAVRLRFGNRLNLILGTQPVDVLVRRRLWRRIIEDGRTVIPVSGRGSWRA